MTRIFAAALALASILVATVAGARPGDGTLRLATTTSTENSGLLKAILPRFEASSGLKVQVISVGTGKAMKLGENGDVDVVLVHSRPDEDLRHCLEKNPEERFQSARDLSFDLASLSSDSGAARPLAAMRRILDTGATFVSRGDDSGTDKMEKGYWKEVGRRPEGRQYLSAGQGMGEVLTMSDNLAGYTLSDRATYGAYRARIGLDILVEGDAKMFNPYGVIAVNPARYPDANFKGAMQFVEWLTDADGRRAISAFRVDGEQLFFPTSR